MQTRTWQLDERTTLVLKNNSIGKVAVILNGNSIYSKYHFSWHYKINLTLPNQKKAIITATTNGMSYDYQLALDDEVMLSSETFSRLPCMLCKTENLPNDKFCKNCGKELPNKNETIRTSHIKEAVKTIRALAALFLLFGIVMALIQNSTTNASLNSLASYQDGESYPKQINGKNYTVGELRKELKFEVWSILVLNGILAVIMFGISIWASTSPLPAIMVAAAIYGSVIIGNAIYDPRTIAQGLIMKIFMISLLIKGIKAALEHRKANV